jgi:hypothetical protein
MPSRENNPLTIPLRMREMGTPVKLQSTSSSKTQLDQLLLRKRKGKGKNRVQRRARILPMVKRAQKMTTRRRQPQQRQQLQQQSGKQLVQEQAQMVQ